MMSNVFQLTCAWALVLGAAVAPARAELLLNDTDRVILFGDTSLSETYLVESIDQFLRSKYPDLKTEVICFPGPDGDAAEGNRRLPIEVLPLQPTWVVLSFGLDAPKRKAFDQQLLDAYVQEMGKMIDLVKQSGAKLLVVTPPPVDESRNKGLVQAHYSEVVSRYAEALRTLAADKNAEMVDWHAAGTAYLEAASDVQQRYSSSRDPLMPSFLMAAIVTDLLLSRWQAEPLDYLISADWTSSETIAVTMGTAKVTEQGDNRLGIALTGVPVALDASARGVVPPEEWPMSKWCSYRLKISHIPVAGVIISESGRAAKPFLTQQLAGGADMSAVGPLVDNKTTRKLRDVIGNKVMQYRHYQGFCHHEAPEPELVEGYRMWLAAYKELAAAAHKIAFRVPSRFDATLTIELADAAADKKPGGKKARSPRQKKPKPKRNKVPRERD